MIHISIPDKMQFTLTKVSNLNRDKLYNISIDVENFPTIMPKYFKSITIKKTKENEKITQESIKFLGTAIKTNTKHIIIHPKIHEVHLLSGPFRGTSFVESYEEIENGTKVVIDVSIRLHGILKIFFPLQFLFKRQMSRVMNEFLVDAERFSMI